MKNANIEQIMNILMTKSVPMEAHTHERNVQKH